MKVALFCSLSRMLYIAMLCFVRSIINNLYTTFGVPRGSSLREQNKANFILCYTCHLVYNPYMTCS